MACMTVECMLTNFNDHNWTLIAGSTIVGVPGTLVSVKFFIDSVLAGGTPGYRFVLPEFLCLQVELIWAPFGKVLISTIASHHSSQ